MELVKEGGRSDECHLSDALMPLPLMLPLIVNSPGHSFVLRALDRNRAIIGRERRVFFYAKIPWMPSIAISHHHHLAVKGKVFLNSKLLLGFLEKN